MDKTVDTLAQSKLLILYLLKKMNMQVSLTHIQKFALSSEYMDYFSLTSYLADMTAGRQISKHKENHQTCYTITADGLQMLSYFENMLSSEMKKNVNNYVEENKALLKESLEVMANYEKIDEENYQVELSIQDNIEKLIDIKLASLSKEYAKTICENWKSNPSSLYLGIIKNLLNNDTKK